MALRERTDTEAEGAFHNGRFAANVFGKRLRFRATEGQVQQRACSLKGRASSNPECALLF